MKRNAIVRIVLWSIVLLVLLAIFLILLYVPGAGRSLRNDPPEESMAAVPLPRVPGSEDHVSCNAVVTDNVNIRSVPDPKGNIVAFADRGTVLQILRQEQIGGKKWGYIGAPIMGWIDMNYVELLNPADVEIAGTDATVAQEPKTEEHAITLDAASIRDMEIEWAVGSIRIQPKDITEIRITEEGVKQAEKPMVWKVQDEKLAIQYAENMKISLGMGIRLEDVSKDLLIEVPMDWQCDSLEITAAAASLEVRDLTIREMEFDGASGACTFENCTIEKLDLNTASGDVHFNGTLQQLDCDAASADIVLSLNNIPKNLDMDTASGDLNLTLPADAGFTVTMDTLSGDFESDFDTTIRNGSYVAGNGHCRIEVDAMSGDVTIRKAS